MSKMHSNQPGQGSRRVGKAWVAAAVVLVVAGAAILIALDKWPGRKASGESAAADAAVTTNAGPATATTSQESKPDLRFLKGRWVRPDGGYVLEIRQVDADGQLDAGYFNPSHIRIASAVARKDGAATKVLIELNDVNYPGCKYNLTYIPNKELLVGTYYQAAMRETFEVGFEREK